MIQITLVWNRFVVEYFDNLPPLETIHFNMELDFLGLAFKKEHLKHFLKAVPSSHRIEEAKSDQVCFIKFFMLINMLNDNYPTENVYFLQANN